MAGSTASSSGSSAPTIRPRPTSTWSGRTPTTGRAGLGRALYERFFEDARAHGARRVKAVTWPGNQTSVKFHTAMGFRPDDGPGTQRLYGSVAYPDYDGDGEDRVHFVRDL